MRLYEARGYHVLERNWRCALGEVDVIATRDDVLVICEVKSRTGVAFGGGYEAVTWSKRRRLRRLAEAFLAAGGCSRFASASTSRACGSGDAAPTSSCSRTRSDGSGRGRVGASD